MRENRGLGPNGCEQVNALSIGHLVERGTSEGLRLTTREMEGSRAIKQADARAIALRAGGLLA